MPEMSVCRWLMLGLSLIAAPIFPIDFESVSPPAISHLTLSASGDRSAWLVREGDDIEVHVGTLEDSESERARPGFGAALARGLYWFGDGLWLHLGDGKGGETLWWIDADTLEARRVFTINGQLRVLGAGPSSTALVTHDRRERWQPDVWSVASSGDQEMLVRNPGRVFAWWTGPSGDVRLAMRWHPAGAGVRYQILLLRNGRFHSAAEYRLGEPSLRPLGMTPDGFGIYLAMEDEHHSGETLRIFDTSVRRTSKALFDSDGRSVAGLIHDQRTGELSAVRLEGQRSTFWTRSTDWGESLAALLLAFPGREFDYLGRGPAESSVWYGRSDRWGGSYLSLSPTQEVKLIARARPGAAYPSMEPFDFETRDGMALGGYLTRPPGDGPHPAVVLVHGGPWSRDRWGFQGEAQFLASLGLAVIQVNFRGSRGLGHATLQAGRRQWGLAMQDDLIDAVAHADRSGWIDPQRVCVMGSSYGGYAALMGVLRDPQVFACAVSRAPVTDLDAHVRAYRQQGNRRALMEWSYMVGRPGPELATISPLTRAKELNRPVLLVHGRQDPVVRFSQSQAFAAAAPVDRIQFLPLESEGHALVHEANRLAYYRAVASFLGEQLDLPR